MGTVDVVIPVRNEGDTIKPIVQAFLCQPWIGQIIVVINGDCDLIPYAKIASMAKLVHRCGMVGKGQACSFGLTYVKTDLVCFCDGDLTGFTPEHAAILTARFGDGRDGMTIGVPDFPPRSPVPWQVRMDIFAQMSGQRCLPTELARRTELVGYCMEYQLNVTAVRKLVPTRFVRLRGVVGKVRQNSQRMAELRRDRAWLTENPL